MLLLVYRLETSISFYITKKTQEKTDLKLKYLQMKSVSGVAVLLFCIVVRLLLFAVCCCCFSFI